MDSEEIFCRICYNPYDSKDHIPRIITNCGHTICSKCIINIIPEKAQSSSILFQCPLDQTRAKVSCSKVDLSHFPKNYSFLKLIEHIEAQENKKFDICDPHKRKFSMVCLTCNIKVCPKCFIGKHQDHNLLDFIDAKQDINEKSRKIKDVITRVNEQRQKYINAAENILNAHEKGLISTLDEKANSIMKRLNQHFLSQKQQVIFYFKWLRKRLLERQKILDADDTVYPAYSKLKSELEEVLSRHNIDNSTDFNYAGFTYDYLSAINSSIENLENVKKNSYEFLNSISEKISKINVQYNTTMLLSLEKISSFPHGFEQMVPESEKAPTNPPEEKKTDSLISKPDSQTPATSSQEYFNTKITRFIDPLLEYQPTRGDFDRYVIDVATGDKKDLLLSVVGIRKFLSATNTPPIDLAISSGIIPIIIKLMYSEDPHIQYESAWIITNCASGNTKEVEYIMEMRAHDALIELLKSRIKLVVEQAVWALGNLAGDSVKIRNMLLERDLMPSLLSIMEKLEPNSNTSNYAIWTISNLCRGRPSPLLGIVKPALPILVKALTASQSNEVKSDAAWAFPYVSEGSNEGVEAILELNFVEVAKKIILGSNQDNLVVPILMSLANIAASEAVQRKEVLGVLPLLYDIIESGSERVLKECVKIIKNLCEDFPSEIINTPDLVSYFNDSVITSTDNIKRNSFLILETLCKKSTVGEIRVLIEQNILETVSYLLNDTENECQISGLAMLAYISLAGQSSGKVGLIFNDFNELFENDNIISKVEVLSTSDDQGIAAIAKDALDGECKMAIVKCETYRIKFNDPMRATLFLEDFS